MHYMDILIYMLVFMFMLMYICIYVRMFIICIYQCMYTCTHACEYTKLQFAFFSLTPFLSFLLLSLHSLTICPSCPSQTLKDLSLTLSLLLNSWEHGLYLREFSVV